MRDKHIQSANDSELLKLIYAKVEAQLDTRSGATQPLIRAKFIFYFGLSILLYSLLYITANPFLFVAVFAAFGFSILLFAFNFAHDFSHNTIFRSKKSNNLAFIVIYSLVGAHAESWKHRHVNSHHYAPNVEDYDTDLQISALIRVIPGSEARWYHRLQHIYAPLAYTTYSLFWVFVKDFVVHFSADGNRAKKYFAYHFSFWTQKTFYLAYILLLPLLFAQQEWYVIFAAFFGMHILQSVFLLFTFFMTHHVESTEYPTTDDEGVINATWLMNQVRSSNDFYPFSKTANFIFGGFNNHIAHHLFPHVHHTYYPELNKILYKTLEEHHVFPNQTTWFGGVVSHLRWLKKMSVSEG